MIDALAGLEGATIAFDLDGTLVDTAPDLVGALNAVLAEQGLPALPFDSVRLMVGRGARGLVERGFAAAGAPLDEAHAKTLTARLVAIYLDRIALESRPFPGVEAALETLRAAGARLVVCTNKLTTLSLALLDALDLTRRFDAVVGAADGIRPKPEPDLLHAAVRAVGGRIDRTVLVGDSINDVGAAKAAGVPCLVVSFGYTEIPAHALGGEAVVDAFDQVPAACAALLSGR